MFSKYRPYNQNCREKRQFQPYNFYNSYNPYNIDRYAPLNIPSNSVSNSNANSQSLSFGNPNYSSSASQANANSNSFGYGPNGFGSGSALAQAQGFQSVEPLGNFGATSSNSHSLNSQAGLNGFQVNILLLFNLVLEILTKNHLERVGIIEQSNLYLAQWTNNKFGTNQFVFIRS